MPTPRLELIIARAVDGTTTATLHLHLDRRRAELAEDVPITIGDEGLRALSLLPAAYGGALTSMVFVPTLREAWQRALGSAEGSGEQLRVSLSLKGDDSLHCLRWELLHDPLQGTPLALRENVLLR